MEHALLLQKLRILRDRDTGVAAFQCAMEDVSFLMAAEAYRDLPLTTARVQTPLRACEVPVVSGPPPALVPILRAGLGLVPGFRRLLPETVVGHLGIYRSESTLKPVEYFGKLPDRLAERRTFVLDPMLATGGSADAALRHLKASGARDLELVVLIAAPPGIDALRRSHPDVRLRVGVVDEGLDERGFIVPGLGDAGDRQFGTETL